MNLEAANLIKFSRNFSEKKNVIFPCPYLNFTQREILVESFHEGSPISDYLEYDDTKFQGKLAKIGITAVLKMVGDNSLYVRSALCIDEFVGRFHNYRERFFVNYRYLEIISSTATYIPVTS